MTSELFTELFDLTGRVALVTGATKGLGRAAAFTLARAGANVGLCSRSEEDARAAAREIAERTGRRTVGMAADVSIAADVTRLTETVARELGPISILLACAGINIRKPTAELTESDWDAVMDSNVKGAFLAAQAVLPGMRDRRWGRIVFFGSILSFVSIPGRAAYASSKAALLGLTRTLALESAADGVCVNAICPGPFKTPMNRAVLEDEAANRAFLAKLPIGRWAEPSELSGAVLFLSSAACGFVTGASLLADGGWTAQ